MDKQADIFTRLDDLARSDFYPFHMPGHKRNMAKSSLSAAYERDITEIDGFDNLHDPRGMLAEAMERARRLYGSEAAFFLVNGSTAGIMAAIHSCLKQGEKILISRNSHKSVYLAAALLHLQIGYFYPEQAPGWPLAAKIPVEEVKRALAEHPDARAALITSPTYEGFASPVREIAELVHKAGLPLIVDEAHGAHFSFSESFPESAVQGGADLVVQSLHKTMPSLTQTALLHFRGNLVQLDAVKRYLAAFQTSSPSYLLMGSIDRCLSLVEGQGEGLWRESLRLVQGFCRETAGLRHLKALQAKEKDPLKLVIAAVRDGRPYGGPGLYRELRERYRLQMEMAAPGYVLGLCSCMDKPEGFRRLAEALREIDQGLEGLGAHSFGPGHGFLEEAKEDKPMRAVETIGSALDREKEWLPLTEAEGRESGSFVSLYPPGIPLIVPGEVISRAFVDKLIAYRREGLPLQGLRGERIEAVRT